MEFNRREFVSLIGLVGVAPIIGSGEVSRPYVHSFNERRHIIESIKSIGSDQVVELREDKYIDSSIVWSMTKDSTPIFTNVRSADSAVAVGLIQFQYERQLADKKRVRIVSYPTNESMFISSAQDSEGEVTVLMNPDFSEYVHRFYASI